MPQQAISITPIIMCGGFGSRLWPLSREDLPKQFLKFNTNRSLFQHTVLRMQGSRAGVFTFEKPIVATAAEHRFLVAEQLRELGVKADILLEPMRRDSAAAILAAAAFCVEQKRKGLTMVVASDHAIPDVSSFHDHVEHSLRAAEDHIVLFGIQPQAASTDYGYISPGDELKKFNAVHRVNKFAEKPSAEVAGIYIAKGYLWNSGNFICKPQLLLTEAEVVAPEIAIPAAKAARNLKHSDDFHYLDEKSFAEAKALSIDFAVLEKTARAAVLPSNFSWSDLGTWSSIHALLEQDVDGNAAIGKAQFTHSSNTLVLGNSALVAVEGLKDVVVAITPDAILVAALNSSASMKPLMEKLKLNHPEVLKKLKLDAAVVATQSYSNYWETYMEYRNLGRSGLKTSLFTLGTMNFDGEGFFTMPGSLDRAQAARMVDIAVEHGVNVFDTSNAYTKGRSESALGEVLKTRSSQLLITTKVRFGMGEGPNEQGLSRHHIIEQCELSLKRLQRDHIDVYLLHEWDGHTPIEETMEALNTLVKQGKVRYIGCSNFSGWHIMKAMMAADRAQGEKFVCQQIHYTIEAREAEYELLPVTVDQGIGVQVWSPIAGGLLSGKFRRNATPEQSRHLDGWTEPPIRDRERLWRIVDALVEVGDAHGVSAAQVALAWTAGRPGISSMVIGARNEAQLKDTLAATHLKLKADERKKLDDVSQLPLLYPYWHQHNTVSERLGTADLALHAPYQTHNK